MVCSSRRGWTSSYVFDDETLSDLERILELKELGFTLAEIHHILSLFRISDMEKTGFREELRVIYAKRRRGCQEEIAHLERISGVLSQKIEALSTVDTSEYRRTGLPLSMLGLSSARIAKSQWPSAM